MLGIPKFVGFYNYLSNSSFCTVYLFLRTSFSIFSMGSKEILDCRLSFNENEHLLDKLSFISPFSSFFDNTEGLSSLQSSIVWTRGWIGGHWWWRFGCDFFTPISNGRVSISLVLFLEQPLNLFLQWFLCWCFTWEFEGVLDDLLRINFSWTQIEHRFSFILSDLYFRCRPLLPSPFFSRFSWVFVDASFIRGPFKLWNLLFCSWYDICELLSEYRRWFSICTWSFVIVFSLGPYS